MIIGILDLNGKNIDYKNILDNLQVKNIFIKKKEQIHLCDGIIISREKHNITTIIEENIFEELKIFIKKNKPIWCICEEITLLSDKINEKIENQTNKFDLDYIIENKFFDSYAQSFIKNIEYPNDFNKKDKYSVMLITSPINWEDYNRTKILEISYENVVAIKQDNILGTLIHTETQNDFNWYKYFICLVKKTLSNNTQELKQGYGKFFTKITYINGFLEKKALNEDGKIKLNNEINFYKFILNKRFNNYLPKILNYSEDYFNMEFLENYITLESYIRSNSIKNNLKLNQIIVNIKEILENNLYTEKILINKNEFDENLLLETTGKILERTSKINYIIEKYRFIKTVNNIITLDLNNIINNIKNFIENYIVENKNFYYYPIHGDIQLNNILINSIDNKIKFIDPRGYFGKSKVYGMKEYDYAKLYFGLGGYSYFDFKNVNELNIDNENITINMKELINILEQPTIIQILIICIWLGNAHCFIENEFKVVESYFYACYISTLVINKIK